MVTYESRAGVVGGEIPSRLDPTETAHESPAARSTASILADELMDVRARALGCAQAFETRAEAQLEIVQRADQREDSGRAMYALGRRRALLTAAKVLRELAAE